MIKKRLEERKITKSWKFTEKNATARLLRVWLVLIVAMQPLLGWSQQELTVDKALALISSGRIDSGMAMLEVMSERGNVNATIELGFLYDFGFGIHIDKIKSQRLFAKAANAGSLEALWWLARTSVSEAGEWPNPVPAQTAYQKGFLAAACLITEAQGVSADKLSEDCRRGESDLAREGKRHFALRRYQAGDPVWADRISEIDTFDIRGSVLRQEWGTAPTMATLKGLIELSRKGSVMALMNIFIPFYESSPAENKTRDALIASLSDQTLSFLKSELMMFTTERFDWYANTFRNAWIAEIFREGIPTLGISSDYGVAERFYQKCASSRDPTDAAMCLNWQGVLKNSGGPGLLIDEKQAVQHFMKAHELGDPIASSNIGEAYMLAQGVELDFEKARQYFQVALDRGYKTAALELAKLYLDGLGTDQDILRAADLYATAATGAYEGRGHPVAMIKLGNLHEQNRLPNSNLNAALRWYEKAIVRNETYENLIVGEQEEATYQAVAAAGIKRVQKRLEELSKIAERVSFGTYKVLLVANERYMDLADLKTPHEDARLVGSIFESKFGAEVEYLIDSNRSELLSTLGKYRQELGPEDNFILYYAGHGVYDEELEVGYWQLSDAEADEDYSWVETDRVSRTLSAFKSRNAMIIADSCYSGSVVRGTSAVGDVSNLSAIKSLNAKKSRVAITSGGLQPVLDVAGSSENSSFAKNFAAALENVHGPTPASVLFNDLRTAVSTETAAWGFEQVPEFAPLYRAGHDGGDFILSPVSK